MADNRYQAAAVNIAEQIAAAFQQLQEKLQQQHANFMLQMQQQHADAMLQMQQQANDMLQRHQQLPATIAQQFAPLNIAPRQLQPDQNDAIIDAAGNTTNKSEANYMHNPSNQNQLHSSTNLVNHSISAIQLPTVSKANQDDLNTIEKLDLTKVVFQTRSSLSVAAGTLPDSDAKVNLLPLNKANLIGFHGSTLPTGLSLVDCSKFITVDILCKDILVKDAKFLISQNVARPILSCKIWKKFCLIPEDFPLMQVPVLDTGQPSTVVRYFSRSTRSATGPMPIFAHECETNSSLKWG